MVFLFESVSLNAAVAAAHFSGIESAFNVNAVATYPPPTPSFTLHATSSAEGSHSGRINKALKAPRRRTSPPQTAVLRLSVTFDPLAPGIDHELLHARAHKR